ncbi:hypothetical protein Tco_1090255, partial [Tanacetum coccineum]
TMADVNVNAPAEQAPAMAPPTRTDDQILPRIRWVPIGKSNCYLDVERSQSNPIYKIAVDILKHTNFFRAFTASSTIPSIYIQQFWDTIRYDNKTGSYNCQLDEQWFDLTKDTLRDALQITPVDTNNAFSSPPTPDALIKFVNDLGYPRVVRTLSDVVTNDMFQPWRALTTVINLCLTGKTSGFERPRAPVLQILWGIVNRAHIDYAERMWEEFTQSIHTFIEDKKNLAPHTQGKKKATLIVILSFSAKGTKREVFGMTIELIYNLSTFEAPSPAKRSKAGKVVKKRTKKSCLQLVDIGVDEGISVQGIKKKRNVVMVMKWLLRNREIERNLTRIVYGVHGVYFSCVFREPDSGISTLQRLNDSFLSFIDHPVGIDLIVSQPVSLMIHAITYHITATVTAITTTTTSLPPIPPQPQQGSLYSILIQCIGELEEHMADMVEANQALEERLDKRGSRLYKLENLNIPHQVSKAVDEIFTDAVD